MVYLLYGLKDFQINEEIKNLTKNQNDMNISRYDLNNTPLKDAIDDAETYSMFAETKTVIVENASMFTTLTSKDSDIVENYLNNINKSTNLIFTAHAEKIDTRKKITKLIKKDGIVKEFNEEISPLNLTKNLLKDYDINEKTINLFLDRVGNNPLIIQNEINKIKIYKNKDKNITDKDIINLTNKNIDIDIFKLIDNIVQENKE